MAYVPLKELAPCRCGGKPKMTKVYGWWHIECRKCGEYPVEYMYGSDSVRVFGWNTRNEAIAAWIKASAGG